jgi:hypothetical protein
VEDLSALKYNFQGDAAAAAAMKASALETSFGTYMRGYFAVLCVVCIVAWYTSARVAVSVACCLGSDTVWECSRMITFSCRDIRQRHRALPV